MPDIIILSGLPRSGKTTFAKEYMGRGFVKISADDMRYLVYNQRFWAAGENLMWSIRNICLEYMLAQQLNIIIDETNTTAKRRSPIIKLAQQYNYNIIGVVIESVTKEICIKRAKDTEREDIIPIIENQHHKFETLEKGEGFNVIKVI